MSNIPASPTRTMGRRVDSLTPPYLFPPNTPTRYNTLVIAAIQRREITAT